MAAQKIDLTEFIRLGFLQEANRQFFHPHGLALEISVNSSGPRLSGIWDARDDPEGIVFEPGPNAEKARLVETERQRHVEARRRLLGSEIQQVGQDIPSRRKRH